MRETGRQLTSETRDLQTAQLLHTIVMGKVLSTHFQKKKLKVREVKYLAQVKASKSSLKNQLLESRAQDLPILLSCIPGAGQGYHEL